MKEQIQAILERELAKLDKLSREQTDPLNVAEIKSLDTIIRAYRSFVDAPAEPEQPPTAPANQSTEDLLRDISDSADE